MPSEKEEKRRVGFPGPLAKSWNAAYRVTDGACALQHITPYCIKKGYKKEEEREEERIPSYSLTERSPPGIIKTAFRSFQSSGKNVKVLN